MVRELTKVHEEVWRGTLAEAAAVFGEHPIRGEVGPGHRGRPAGPALSDEAIDDAVRQRSGLGPGSGPRQIADAMAGELGVPRRKVYEAVLRLRDESEGRSQPVR